MKNTFIIAFLLPALVAKAQVSVSWFNYPGGVAVAADSQNNVYTANWDYNPAGDITLTKRDSTGAIIWETAYNNTNTTRHEVATWLDTDNEDNILVSGTIRSGYSNPVNANSLLMKFNSAGNLLWRVVYETDFDGSSTRKCLIDSNNNIYVLGLGNSGTGIVTTVKKFNAAGTQLWSFFDAYGIGSPANFKFTPDNGILITARSVTGSMSGYAKIDLNGNLIWNLAGIYSLTYSDAAGDIYGNTYLIHGENVASNPGSVLKKLTPAGSLIWEKTNDIAGMRIETGTDNQPVICGYPNTGSFGTAFIKYDTNGNVLWENLDADGPSLSLLAHAQLRLDNANAAYLVAGTMFAMAVCKVNANGTSAWTATTTGSYGYAIDFGTDNCVFLVGGTTAKLAQPSTGTPLLKLKLTAVLEGVYNPATNTMDTALRNHPSGNLLPFLQPFTQPPFNYTGTEYNNAAPQNAVDWVLVELRTGASGNTIAARKAAFLLSDGVVKDAVDSGAADGVTFAGVPAGNYFVSLKTRTHLAVLSATAVALPNDNILNFTQTANIMGGATQVVSVTPAVFALAAGDVNHDGVITLADYNSFAAQTPTVAYNSSDVNLDGTVSNADFELLRPNLQKLAVSQVR
ncbi:hypothetical protein C7N43_06425 [Sphingobacteriales bacterium UPWRP_1]|nr:hypothetical protein BVG80_12470 [Sphingobacteriales bacterium TSM_CSM]PSJ77844.1 hypothetical protein C7N43_06425 [Sphingobacteriales bacterium UPWRP_1]